LQKTCDAELQRGAGNLVNLIESRDVAYLDRYRRANASDPHQPEVMKEERRPGPDSPAPGRI
jgi:hypothetical protein